MSLTSKLEFVVQRWIQKKPQKGAGIAFSAPALGDELMFKLVLRATNVLFAAALKDGVLSL